MSPDHKPSHATERAVIGPYRYVDNEKAMAQLIDELSSCDRYGIDTEFVRERTYYARLALVQISWADNIAIVDPEQVDPAGLAPILSGPALAIVHAADQDLEVLERSCGAVPKVMFDTQLAAGFIGMSTPGLQSLVETLLHLRLEKGDQLADWSKRPLSDSQLRYAAGDVAFLLELHDILVDRLTKSGRLEWAQIECDELLHRERTPVVPDEAWWRLKHARQLRGHARQVAQCVASWREERAQALDIPVRFILSDLAMASIAQRPPHTRKELEGVRSIDARHLAGGVAEELLGAIATGLSLDASKLRLPPVPAGDNAPKAAVTMAAAWVGERAHQLGIDPTLLATRGDLSEYLRDPSAGRLATSWREPLIGEPIRRLIAGEASLALSGGSTLVLEERSHRPIAPDAPPTASKSAD